MTGRAGKGRRLFVAEGREFHRRMRQKKKRNEIPNTVAGFGNSRKLDSIRSDNVLFCYTYVKNYSNSRQVNFLNSTNI